MIVISFKIVLVLYPKSTVVFSTETDNSGTLYFLDGSYDEPEFGDYKS